MAHRTFLCISVDGCKKYTNYTLDTLLKLMLVENSPHKCLHQLTKKTSPSFTFRKSSDEKLRFFYLASVNNIQLTRPGKS